MDRPMPQIMFRGMSMLFWVRNLLNPPERVLANENIQKGSTVLDYGCGPGAFIPELATRVGPSGHVYALDIHPLAAQRVQRMTDKKQWSHVHTICSDCETGLPDNSVDTIILYDIIHMLSESDKVLAELSRVLKPDGTLSVLDPHISEHDLVNKVTKSQTFLLQDTKNATYHFSPIKNPS